MPQNKEKINYQKIIKSAFEISWRNKILWWFGFLASLGGGSQVYYSGDSNELEMFSHNISWEIIIPLIIIFIFINLGILILSSLGIASLISFTGKIITGESRPQKKLITLQSKEDMWKIAGLRLALFLILLIVTIVVLIPPIYLATIQNSWGSSVSLFGLAMLIIFPVSIILFYIKQYAYFYMVIGKLSIKEAVTASYNIFIEKLQSSIIMGIILFAINIALLIGLAVLLLLIALASLALGFILYYSLGKVAGIILASIIAVVVIGISFFILRSIIISFHYTAWLLFFQEIAGANLDPKDKALAQKKIALKETI